MLGIWVRLQHEGYKVEAAFDAMQFDKSVSLMLNSSNKEKSMGKKILVVDDETDLLKVTSLRLKKAGYDVFGCADGQGVLDLARQIIPDLIILDVYLPVINGDDVAKILKKEDGLKHIPIILISASTRILDEKAWGSGADAYLKKPFEPEALISTVKNILG
jgi:DNA-binding response OmpR family regulator